MMVSVITTPIAAKVLKVKIVALHRFLAILDNLYCSLINCHRRQVYNVGPCPLRDFNDLGAEKTEITGNNRIALFEQIAQYCLCARKAGARDTQGHLVLCLEHPAQQLSSLFQDSKKLGIKMTKLRC